MKSSHVVKLKVGKLSHVNSLPLSPGRAQHCSCHVASSWNTENAMSHATDIWENKTGNRGALLN